MTTVKIRNGIYRGTRVNDVAFTLVKDFQTGAKGNFVTVKSGGFFGDNVPENVRITVDSIEDVEVVGSATPVAYTIDSINRDADAPADFQLQETGPIVESDEAVMARIGERFSIMDAMTQAVVEGIVRSMIVVGPPGVGKSYGIVKKLEEANLFNLIASDIRYEVVKGATTALGLYAKLYEFSREGGGALVPPLRVPALDNKIPALKIPAIPHRLDPSLPKRIALRRAIPRACFITAR